MHSRIFSQLVLLFLHAAASEITQPLTDKAGDIDHQPQPRVLFLEPINYFNKTVKILTGQQRPLPPPPQNRPMSIQNGYYPNQYHQQFPQTSDLTGQGSGPQPSFQQPKPHPPESAVPDAYVQIIGAIEKLVGKIDKLDSRLSTMENIVLHLTNKQKDVPQKGNCPEDFVKIDGVRGKCYHVSTLRDDLGQPAQFDWTSAHAKCNKIGGRLVEMVHYDDFLRISQFLVKYSASKVQTSTDYWIGGINPGLIWIWSESGQKVDSDRQFWNDNDNSSNAPGCLKLSYSKRLETFFFKGAPCSHSQNIICEMLDNSVSRALALFEQELIQEDEHDNETTIKPQ